MTETTELPTASEGTSPQAPAAGGGLAGLKLAQLQALASQLGITGGSRMRKSDLVAAISSHQRGGSVADRKAAQPATGDASQEAAGSEAGAPARNGRRSAAPAAETAGAAPSAETSGDSADAGRAPERPARRSRSRRAESPAGASAEAGAAGTAVAAPAEGEGPAQQAPAGSEDQAQQSGRGGRSERGGRGEGRDSREPREGGRDSRDSREEGEQEQSSGRGRRSERGGRDNGRDAKDGREGGRGERGDRAERGDRDGGQQEQSSGRGGRDGRGGRNDGDDDGTGRRNRRNRNRNDRNRNRRGRGGPEVDDTEVTEDDVLLPVAGILDVLDNYAFVRTSGYLPGSNDVYVSLSMVKKYGLRKGDAVTGAIRAPRDGENSSGGSGGSNRQKFNALVRLTSVNGQAADENPKRVEFSKLVPLYPQERLRLETDPKLVGPRVIDLVAPIGKGQRGLIVSPPKAGKTMILQSIANAITTNNPEVHLMMVLVDERPEEVTDMQRSVKGEVIASTFDRPADDHTTVAELAIERAKRLVEMGRDVVVLLDSMTRLGRAYNLAAPASGRILSGGVDSSALYPPKRFFGAARNIENGGSLTILATALVETGSKMDEVIFEEFKGTGNMELRLSRQLADKRIFPAVDVNASGTRREENLLSPEEIKIMWKLRRVLSGLDTQQALEILTNKIRDTQSNAEFLMLVSKTTLGPKGEK
ncbi:transcription termination factor Rho [Citricoccus sp. SGAir0253]|uniref:transcription termination factor Rho n=1 Tax=Citricoccus sp. SGAir0253 TaxID=2567881 RepID=UPI0010CD47C2|nr:transcription termination factor Rho [Citricoccus sp. SGAir0253]QCU78423.1 transcription termination factor Rho [Citricoccus sp. SGAir0253]